MENKTIIVLLLLLMLLMNNNKTNETFPQAGGLQEWTTDQDIDSEEEKDEDAKALAMKAGEEDICVPIGEGENCW